MPVPALSVLRDDGGCDDAKGRLPHVRRRPDRLHHTESFISTQRKRRMRYLLCRGKADLHPQRNFEKHCRERKRDRHSYPNARLPIDIRLGGIARKGHSGMQKIHRRSSARLRGQDLSFSGRLLHRFRSIEKGARKMRAKVFRLERGNGRRISAHRRARHAVPRRGRNGLR